MNNPQAFPCLNDPLTGDSPGMTLRDYFAAKAMQGELASQHAGSIEFKNKEYRGAGDAAEIADWAYLMAAAMLAAREKP